MTGVNRTKIESREITSRKCQSSDALCQFRFGWYFKSVLFLWASSDNSLRHVNLLKKIHTNYVCIIYLGRIHTRWFLLPIIIVWLWNTDKGWRRAQSCSVSSILFMGTIALGKYGKQDMFGNLNFTIYLLYVICNMYDIIEIFYPSTLLGVTLRV